MAQLESLLEEARNAAAALEQSRALAALERAERLLREHPELPQSAWMMAEILEQSAELASSAPDGADAASALRKRATLLEGPRAAPFADRAPEREPAGGPSQPVNIEGLEPGDALEWDGVETESALTTTAGTHHARVARNGRLMWTGWIEVAAGKPSVRLPVPETVACSADDIGRGHFGSGRAVAAAHARCESYVLARARPGGGLEIALCEREQCGKVVIWEHARENGAAAPATKKTIWPYAVAASVGALAITSIALWRAGVFDRAEPSAREVWVWSGQKQMALGF